MKGLDFNLYESFSTGVGDCSGNTTDASGNTTDCSGNIILEASNNNVDISNNANTDVSGNTTTTITVEKEDNDNLSIILTYENLYILFWIVSVYFILYSLLAFFFRSENLGYVYNVIILLTIIGIVIAYYIMTDTDEYKDDAENTMDRFLSFFDNKFNALYLIAGLVLLYVITSIINIPSNREDRPTMIIGLETLLMILLILIVFVQFFSEFSNISLTNELRELLGINPSSNSTKITVTEVKPRPRLIPRPLISNDKKEVFNVGGNHYTYSDAEAICKSFDAELADYDKIEATYNKGGEWCNYGWSKNQMALFPTQKSTWNKLQEKEGTKNNCGRPGINGGYMANPALRFGVNCYGVKPEKRSNDFAASGDIPMTTPEDKLIDSKVQFWKDNKDKLKLNHYNNNDWSRY